ncbi:hypothetical protein ABMA79_10295 [Halobacteriovorax sp. HFRX-2_2]|uniref:hypothetical protein n=1 Tax=unclassified Halobacteriovorax TaxID=2639665 RepID=UPI0037169EFE
MKHFSILTIALTLSMINVGNETHRPKENQIKHNQEQTDSISRIRLHTRRSLYYFPFIPRYMVA